MSTVHLEYNPITRCCRTRVRGLSVEDLDQRFGNRGRIQGWIGEYLNEVREQVGANSFDLTFHGTRSDYEDVVGEYQRLCESGRAEATIELKRDPADPQIDFEAAHRRLVDVLERIRKHPAFASHGEFIDGVNKVLNNNGFRVAVMATMSSGKSTLLNAMLGKDLLPSGNFATTALLTYIKDVDGKTDVESWAYNPQGELLRHDRNVDAATLEQINTPHRDDTVLDIDDPKRVLRVDLELDVDWIDTFGAGHLVLIDTPGPNTAGNGRHREVTEKLLQPAEEGDDESADVVLYIMDYTNMEVNDDREFLEAVAQQIREAGIAASDRFLFVINRINEHKKKKDGPLNSGITKATDYLRDHFKIENPTVIAVDALGARLARTQLNGIELDEEEEDDLDRHHRKLTRFLDVNSVALCSPIVKEEIEAQVDSAGDRSTELLHRSGQLLLEAYLRHYMLKYWYPLKLQIAYQRMHGRLLAEDSLLEALEDTILAADEDVDRVRADIAKLDEVIQDRGVQGELTATFDREQRKIRSHTLPCLTTFQRLVMKSLDDLRRGADTSPAVMKRKISKLECEVAGLSGQLRVQHERQMSALLRTISDTLQEAYARRLARLLADKKLKIKPPELSQLSSQTVDVKRLLPKYKATKPGTAEVKVKQKRAWFNPVAWFKGRDYIDTVIKNIDVPVVRVAPLLTRIGTDLQGMNNAYLAESRRIQTEGLTNLRMEIQGLVTRVNARLGALSRQMREKTADRTHLEHEARKARRVRDEYRALMDELETVAMGPFSC